MSQPLHPPVVQESEAKKRLTQKELTELVKQSENKFGSTSSFPIPGCDAVVIVESEYIRGTGPHRAWKYLYFLKINGQKLGGYDRRDSFVAWATQKINDTKHRPDCKDWPNFKVADCPCQSTPLPSTDPSPKRLDFVDWADWTLALAEWVMAQQAKGEMSPGRLACVFDCVEFEAKKVEGLRAANLETVLEQIAECANETDVRWEARLYQIKRYAEAAKATGVQP